MKKLLYLSLCWLATLGAFAQDNGGTEKAPSLQDLEERRKKHEKELAEAQKQFNSSKKNEVESLSKLNGISRQLAKHKLLIEDIQTELVVIESYIAELELQVKHKEKQRKQYEDEYQKALAQHQKGGLSMAYKELISYFSANSITDLMTKENIWKEYSKERSKQIKDLKQAIYLHQRSISEHQETLKLKASLKAEQEQQLREIADLESKQRHTLDGLKAITHKVEAQLNNKKDFLKQLNTIASNLQANQAQIAKGKEISSQFAREEAAKNTAVMTSKPTPLEPTRKPILSAPTDVIADKEALMSSKKQIAIVPHEPKVVKNFRSFEEAKGFLDSPVKGSIAVPFGKQPHPLSPRVMIENLGVDIRTAPNAAIKNVFAGVVSLIHKVNGSGLVIVVQHGDFFSVYARVKESTVEVGQKVKQGETLGFVGENTDGYYELQFQIWSKTQKLNPEDWVQF